MVQYNEKSMERLLRAKITRGLQEAAEKLQELHQEDIAVPVVRDEHGRVIERSQAGEYPRLESGQGQENVDTAIDRSKLESATGFLVPEAGKLTADSRHMTAGGEHMAILRTSGNRKGIDDTLRENLDEVAAAFVRGAR